MASGTLGTATRVSTSAVVIYTVPASTRTTCNINCTNVTTGSVKLKLGIERLGATASLSNGEYIEYDYILGPGDTLERTGVVLKATDSIVAQSDTANSIDVNVWGLEVTA